MTDRLCFSKHMVFFLWGVCVVRIYVQCIMLSIVMPSVNVKPSVIGLSISFYPVLFFISYILFCNIYICYFYLGGRRDRGRDRRVVGFITSCAISAYHH